MNRHRTLAACGRHLSPAAGRRPLAPAAAFFCLLLLTVGGCSGDRAVNGAENQHPATPPVPVTVADVARKDMPVELAAIGTVEPFATVGIKSQVAGILEKVNFKEGEPVKAGDLLFTIDARPFTAQLRQAQANLARDQASLDNAQRQAKRYLPAAEKGYVSAEQSDQAQTSAATGTSPSRSSFSPTTIASRTSGDSRSASSTSPG